MTQDRRAISWRETRERLSQDLARLRRLVAAQFGTAPGPLWLHPAAVCLLLYRVSHYFWQRGHRKSARLVYHFNTLLTGADIHPQNDILGGLLIPHPTGCALMCSAGRNLVVMSRSGSGMVPKMRDVGAGPGVPLLGDDCMLGPFCGIEGPRRIGNRVRLVTGIVVTRDVPDDSIVVMAHPPVPGSAPAAPPPHARGGNSCGHGSLRRTLRDFLADLDAHNAQARGHAGAPRFTQRLSALLTTQTMALALYRLSHLLHARDWIRAATWVARLNRRFSRATINPASCVGPGWFLPHPSGVLFNARAGKDLVLFAFTIVSTSRGVLTEPVERGPVIGDGVVLSAHSAILGPVCVGDNVRLTFGVHATEDLPSDRLVTTAAGRAAIEGRAERARPEVPPPDGDRTLAPPGLAVERAEMRAAVQADWARLLDYERPRGVFGRIRLRISSAWLCVRLYRAASWQFSRRQLRRAQLLWQLNMWLTGADLRPWSSIGPGLLVPYPACVSVNGHAGRNLTLMALSGIDPDVDDAVRPAPPHGLPVLGDDVTMDHHSGVLGPVRIGDRVVLAPNSRATKDVAADVTLVPPPLRVQRRTRITGPLSVEALQPRREDPEQAPG